MGMSKYKDGTDHFRNLGMTRLIALLMMQNCTVDSRYLELAYLE